MGLWRVHTGLMAALLLASSAAAVQPLQIGDPTPRSVLIEREISSNPATVGQSYGPTFPATYSAAGGMGTLFVTAQTFAQMHAGFPTPIPETFTPFVIEIDLATGHATSQAASGSAASGPVSSSFNLHPLSSDAELGVIGPSGPHFPCTSQADVDAYCQIVPLFCGQTCTIVSGSAFDPATGKLNLVGTETQSGCDGAVCQGPFTYFSKQGDVRLSEASVAAAPLLSASARALLAAALLAAGLAGAQRRMSVAPATRGRGLHPPAR